MQEKVWCLFKQLLHQKWNIWLFGYPRLSCAVWLPWQSKEYTSCNCVSYDRNSRDLKVGYCIYTCHFKMLQYINLPINPLDWNNQICGKFNRKGSLCGQCKDSYLFILMMLLVSPCNDNRDWWKCILIAFLPLTVFFVVIVAFKINIHSSYQLLLTLWWRNTQFFYWLSPMD